MYLDHCTKSGVIVLQYRYFCVMFTQHMCKFYRYFWAVFTQSKCELKFDSKLYVAVDAFFSCKFTSFLCNVYTTHV